MCVSDIKVKTHKNPQFKKIHFDDNSNLKIFTLNLVCIFDDLGINVRKNARKKARIKRAKSEYDILASN